MIFLMNAQGEVRTLSHKSLNKGELGVNNIILFAPYMASVRLHVTLPNKIALEPLIMNIVEGETGLFNDSNTPVYAYKRRIDKSLTSIEGTLSFQFFVTTQHGELSSSLIKASVNAGTNYVMPEISQDDLNYISQALAIIGDVEKRVNLAIDNINVKQSEIDNAVKIANTAYAAAASAATISETNANSAVDSAGSAAAAASEAAEAARIILDIEGDKLDKNGAEWSDIGLNLADGLNYIVKNSNTRAIYSTQGIAIEQTSESGSVNYLLSYPPYSAGAETIATERYVNNASYVVQYSVDMLNEKCAAMSRDIAQLQELLLNFVTVTDTNKSFRIPRDASEEISLDRVTSAFSMSENLLNPLYLRFPTTFPACYVDPTSMSIKIDFNGDLYYDTEFKSISSVPLFMAEVIVPHISFSIPDGALPDVEIKIYSHDGIFLQSSYIRAGDTSSISMIFEDGIDLIKVGIALHRPYGSSDTYLEYYGTLDVRLFAGYYGFDFIPYNTDFSPAFGTNPTITDLNSGKTFELPELANAGAYVTVDYENQLKYDACKYIEFFGSESFSFYEYNGTHGVALNVGKGCTGQSLSSENTIPTLKSSLPNYPMNTLWIGYGNGSWSYWIGILDILGFTTKNATYSAEDKTTIIASFKEWVRDRHNVGKPIKIFYESSEPVITNITGNGELKVTPGNLLQFNSSVAVTFTATYVVERSE